MSRILYIAAVTTDPARCPAAFSRASEGVGGCCCLGEARRWAVASHIGAVLYFLEGLGAQPVYRTTKEGLATHHTQPRSGWPHTTRYPWPAGRRAAAYSALQRAPARLRGTHGRVTGRAGRAGPGRWWASSSPTAPRRICRRRRPPRPRLYDRRRTAAACKRPRAAAGLPSAAEGGPSQTGWSRRAPGLKWPALQQRPSFLRPVAGLGRRV
jgi:hypothetical protein